MTRKLLADMEKHKITKKKDAKSCFK